ncbi:MATE family efflux transporter [Microbacterium sp. Leaf161]|uniref:MATE family efflux transporter n=1 Tax=Microbacterium sp. Leaf161 TaxID=1736281 RepID=UPI0006F1FAA5|nr:MATE family efflux transporter [Microbacterium sp. Leaf161]KQR47445.1 MATE family efflux transporter [Microbacterium sp. Leaf161]
MPRSLLVGTPWKGILAFATPLLLGNLFQQAYHFVDAIVVGRLLGVSALAAVGATSSLVFLLIGFAWGAASGFAIPAAQAFGSGDQARLRRSVAAGVSLTLFTSLVITILGPLVTKPALVLLQTPQSLLNDATTFAQITFLGGSLIMGSSYLAALVRAIGDSRTPLIFLALSSVINIALVFIAVGGIGLGIAGAALATIVSQGISVVLCLIYIRRRVPALQVGVADFRGVGASLWEHARLGLPMGFQSSIIAIGLLTVQVAVNGLGADAVAAYTAAGRVDGVAVAFLSSLGMATSVFAAQNLGAGRSERLHKGVAQSVVIAGAAAVVLGSVLVVGGAAIVSLFTGEGAEDVIRMAWIVLVVNGASYPVLAVLFIFRYTLQGLGQPLMPTLSGLAEVAARVIAAITLGSLMGYVGVALTSPIAWAAAVTLLIPAVLRARRNLRESSSEASTFARSPAH